MRSETNIPQSHIPSIKIIWQALDQELYKKFCKKKSKVPKSMKKLAPVFFISFERVKYHKIATNTSRTTQIFWNLFMRQLKGTGVQVARIGMKIAKTHKKLKRKPKAQALSPIPTRICGSGSPERIRGVGLIRI